MITNLYAKLAQAEIDPEVGIALCKLTGDESLSSYVASVEPGKSLPPHFHRTGIELYQLISGTGMIHLGNCAENGKVNWSSKFTIVAGDCFTIEPMTMHQLHCGNAEPMTLIFTCPESHLKNDRTIINVEETK